MQKQVASAVFLVLILLMNENGATASEPALAPMQFAAFCVRYPADCGNSAGDHERWGDYRQLKNINISVNTLITPDQRPDDNWDLFPQKGNCGDYAVSKRHTLLALGWPTSKLRLAEVVLKRSGEHHLVLFAQRDGTTWVLDNLNNEPRTLEQTKRWYSVVKVESSDNPTLWRTSIP